MSDVLLAHRLADIAAQVALSYPGGQVTSWSKPDGSTVTEADLAVEQALLAVLATERPDDSVLSEEAGAVGPASARRWILDPIDGTSSFANGIKDWGTHIALEVDGRLAVAVITRPVVRQRWWAVQGQGAYRSTDDAALSTQHRLHTSAVATLSQATIGGMEAPTSPDALTLAAQGTWVTDELSVVGALIEGRIDVLFDDAGAPWDQAPAVLLTLEAGGRFRDPYGGQRFDLAWGLYSNAHLTGQLLETLPLAGPVS